ncbi:MAG: BCCT family transporter [Myxococcales bacterium]|nr:BCCT family transporter [Myxococcales bacterium]
MRSSWSRVEPAVFLSSAGLVLLLLVFGVVAPERARDLFVGLQDRIVGRLGWLFVGSMAAFLVFVVWCAWGERGRLRLGADDAEPDFSLPSWFAMLFSAGMGIGIMFYGVAEPVLHAASPPSGVGGTTESAQQAMTIAFFHWGLHAWGVYAAMGLAIAYFGHRRGLPLAIRSTLRPLFGARMDGFLGHAVDVFAVFGTLFGLATSLGLGAMQINAGLHRLTGLAMDETTQVGLIAIITAAATTSVVLGLDRGIRRLSELNVALACGLLLFVAATGPTWALVGAFVREIVDYSRALVPLSVGWVRFGDDVWQKDWTLFYWAWWIAWSPFVGLFIARISRGRTIREFVWGVLLVPSLVSFVWFTVFGWSALVLDGREPGITAAVERDLSVGIYALLERLPAAEWTSFLAALVVAIFFVTSSDSGSFVVDMLTSGGHPDPPVWQRVFWAVSEGVVAGVLLVSGGLEALRSAAINTGLPFCVILLLVCIGLGWALRSEVATVRAEGRRRS